MMNNTELMTSVKGEVAQANIYDLYTNTLTPLTKVNYVSTIKSFFGVHDLSQITVEDMQSVTPDVVNAWANRQYAEGIAKSTINRKLSAMYSFYKFLCRRNVGVMSYNPFATDEGAIRFKNATKDYSDKRVLTADEVRAMFKLARKEGGIIGTRDLLVLQLLATTGMRRAELCSIKIGDIQMLDGKHIVNITGKGDKKRIIMLTDHIWVLVEDYLEMRHVTLKDRMLPLIVSHSSNADPTKHLDTTTIYRIVKKYAAKAGIDESTISPHCFRATYATLAYGELGSTKDELQELMGHTSVATTSRYIKTLNMLKNSPAEKLESMFE